MKQRRTQVMTHGPETAAASVRVDFLRDGRWFEGPVFEVAKLMTVLELSAFLAVGVEALRGVLIGAAEEPGDVLALEWTVESGWLDVWQADFPPGIPYKKPAEYVKPASGSGH